MGCRDEAVLQGYWEAVKRANCLACARKIVIEIGRPINRLGIQNFSDAVGLEFVS